MNSVMVTVMIAVSGTLLNMYLIMQEKMSLMPSSNLYIKWPLKIVKLWTKNDVLPWT